MANVQRNDPAAAARYFEDKLSFTTGPKELEEALAKGDVIAVDVRAKKDFDEAHIPGSVNLPKDRWSSDDGLSKEKPLVILCYFQQCHLAARACVALAQRGYSVIELEGGFAAWKEHGGAVEHPGEAQQADAVGRARAFMEEKRETESRPPAAPVKISAAGKNGKKAETEAEAEAEAKADAKAQGDADGEAQADEADADAKAEADAEGKADAGAKADADTSSKAKPDPDAVRPPAPSRLGDASPTSVH